MDTDGASLGAAPDTHLIRHMIEGSEEALAALYDRHSSAVFTTALRTCGDRSLATEVLQDTFLTLWDRAERFDESRGSLRTWLTTIARNRAIDHLRATRRVRTTPFSWFGGDETESDAIAERLEETGELVGAAQPEAGPEATLLRQEARASITAGLAHLGLPERQVVQLAYGEGLSQSEIATRLGWPLGTVKTRTRRAHRQLRDLLTRP
ncbi:MAG: RNA polymerase sigma factor [Candidatus Limnocylindrales bacterium]